MDVTKGGLEMLRAGRGAEGAVLDGIFSGPAATIAGFGAGSGALVAAGGKRVAGAGAAAGVPGDAIAGCTDAVSGMEAAGMDGAAI